MTPARRAQRRPSTAALLLAVVAIWGAPACSSLGGEPECPNDLPPACPSQVPSYQADIAPIIAARCVSCHGPSGVEAKRSLDKYAEVYGLRTAVLGQVYACRMPLDGSLSAAERAKLLAWLVCRAPNN